MKFGKKSLTIALLFVGLVLVNYLARSLPVRLDATAEHIYTLSPGTKSLLGKITEPITLDFYFSSGGSGLRIDEKNYAERVREMLRQYVRQSHGKITLNVIDPEPDTPEEEKATAAGLEPQRMQTGADTFYFGLVATQADQQKALPSLTPEREQFLEYDLSELIYSIQQLDKKKLGLITSLPLQGGPANPRTGQPGAEGQYVVTEWQDTFDIVSVDADRHRAAGQARRAGHHPSRKSHAEAAVRDRPIPAQRQAGLRRRRPVVAVFQAAGRPAGHVQRPAAEHLERPAGPARRLGHRLQSAEGCRGQ